MIAQFDLFAEPEPVCLNPAQSCPDPVSISRAQHLRILLTVPGFSAEFRAHYEQELEELTSGHQPTTTGGEEVAQVQLVRTPDQAGREALAPVRSSGGGRQAVRRASPSRLQEAPLLSPKDKVRLLEAIDYPHMGFQRLQAEAGTVAVVDSVEYGPGALLAFYDAETRQTTKAWVNRSKLEVVG